MRIVLVIACLACLAAASACGRDALLPSYGRATADAALDLPRDVPSDLAADHVDARPDLAPDVPVDHPPDVAPDRVACVPTGPEECNGLDDDCNGLIDDGLPPIPCDNGARLCIAGHYTECPRRCSVCVPHSERTCLTSFCSFWGSQTCAADGMSFSRCVESEPPSACQDVAKKMMHSPELEMCCIKNNFCCVDEFDLNGNGDRTEMLGRCEAVVCE